MKARLGIALSIVAAALPAQAVTTYTFSAPMVPQALTAPRFVPGMFTGTLIIDGTSFVLESSNGNFRGTIPESQFVTHDILGDLCQFLNIDFARQTVQGVNFLASPAWEATAHYASVSAVPEPSTYALLLAGLAGIVRYRNRRYSES